jgi:pimeloyl-ACP methyl ester carboxylesterase
METSPHIILVHGLGRSQYDMFLLARRLRRSFPDSRVHTFDYHSRSLPLAEATLRLADFVEKKTHGEPCSLVGHSLGGIISRSLDATEQHSAPLQRLVTLGSPHNGARIAEILARYRIPRALFGPVLEELGSLNLPPRPRQLEIGCIVGATNTRFGFFPVFGEDNDGLVLKREALLADCTAYVSLPAFHGLMPFSRKIADLTASFLAHGRFVS